MTKSLNENQNGKKTFQNFEEFWPYYLGEHSKPLTRRFHFWGLSMALFSGACGFFTQESFYFWMMPVFGYGLAWVSHFFIEKNRPATFTYPLLSLRGDLRMWWLVLRGRLSVK